ncbi:MAG: 50S ribosomal protein L24 [Weeksellaceae bacterium]|nr:50S ribosomal protein L24 [Weeksellaceae bacterium]
MAKVKIKKGDQVIVLSGKDKGTKGQVLRVFPDKNRVIVEGVAIMKRHTKPSANNPQGGIVESEASIHISNVALVDAEGKASRVGYKTENDKKVRFLKTTGKTV